MCQFDFPKSLSSSATVPEYANPFLHRPEISDSKLSLFYHPLLQKEELFLQNTFGPHSILGIQAFK